MREWIGKLGMVFLAVGVLAAGCASADDSASPTEVVTSSVPVVMQESEERILAEAIVEPARSVTLLAPVGGTV